MCPNLISGISYSDLNKKQNAALDEIFSARIITCVAGVWPSDQHCLTEKVALSVIRASGTKALVVHIPNSVKSSKTLSDDCLAMSLIAEKLEGKTKGFLYNTSLCNNLEQVNSVVRIMQMNHQSSYHDESYCFLKLEILDHQLKPDDQKTIDIIRGLDESVRSICIPFLHGSTDSVRSVTNLGCPAARIWCSPIGKGLGIIDRKRLEKNIKASDIPLVLEGGIATVSHVKTALHMGFSSVLLNSAFRNSPDPVKLAREIRKTIDEWC